MQREKFRDPKISRAVIKVMIVSLNTFSPSEPPRHLVISQTPSQLQMRVNKSLQGQVAGWCASGRNKTRALSSLHPGALSPVKVWFSIHRTQSLDTGPLFLGMDSCGDALAELEMTRVSKEAGDNPSFVTQDGLDIQKKLNQIFMKFAELNAGPTNSPNL